jgi:hypothetical protein
MPLRTWRVGWVVERGKEMSGFGVQPEARLGFLRCQRCRRVFRIGDLQGGCPRCGTEAGSESWPVSLGERLFCATEEFFQRGDRELTLILACDFLETLFEMFLTDLFLRQGRPPAWIQLILRKNRSLNLRLTYLLKETLDTNFSSVIQGSPFEGFDRGWATIRSTRNVLTHARPTDLDENVSQHAYDLSRESLALFAWLNNQYCV